MKSFIITLFAVAFCNAQSEKLTLIVGTYNNNCPEEGIYVYNFDANTGEFSIKNKFSGVDNPSFISISKDNKFLYTVNESGESSGVTSLKFNKNTGEISFISKYKMKNGIDPCYIINDATNVVTANYTSGNISLFGKNQDGSINSKQVFQHFGKSVDTLRQKKSHIHSVTFSEDKKYMLATDLGGDKIYTYRYDVLSQNNNLILIDSVAATKGGGPRHLVFGKNMKNVYVLNEMSGKIEIYDYKDGKMKKRGNVPLSRKKVKGEIGASDIHISPDGKFLYAANRGTANEISTFAITETGLLSFKECKSTMGEGPRNFVIDPTGNFLLIGNQNSNEISIFKINKTTGVLKYMSKITEVCSPVCLVFTL